MSGERVYKMCPFCYIYIPTCLRSQIGERQKHDEFNIHLMPINLSFALQKYVRNTHTHTNRPGYR